jgi:hypothetical protein
VRCRTPLANAAQDGIELSIADVEGVVVALELLVVIEKERERVVETYRREMAVFRIGMEASRDPITTKDWIGQTQVTTRTSAYTAKRIGVFLGNSPQWSIAKKVLALWSISSERVGLLAMRSLMNTACMMTQKWRLVSHFPSARWVPANPENAPVNSLTPANGIGQAISKIWGK